jgi:hypothetical protein
VAAGIGDPQPRTTPENTAKEKDGMVGRREAQAPAAAADRCCGEGGIRDGDVVVGNGPPGSVRIFLKIKQI